jgi:SAM-dependent methyltransferase
MRRPTKRPGISVREFYSNRVGLYERFFTRGLDWPGILEEFFLRTGLAKESERVLDAGCGTGAVTRAIWRAGRMAGGAAVIHAFDLSEQMLEPLRRWIRESGARGVDLRAADALRLDAELPAGWADYDLVVCSTMIEYIDPAVVPQVVRDLSKRLRRGGRLLLIVTKRTPLTRVLAGAWWGARTYTPQRLHDLLGGMGLPSTRWHRLKPPWHRFIMTAEVVRK